MRSPKKPTDALPWIQEALRDGNYFPSHHFPKRLSERRIAMADVHHAVGAATDIRPYDGDPVHGGTCWRVSGPDVDEETEIQVGVEAFYDTGRKRAFLCTVF